MSDHTRWAGSNERFGRTPNSSRPVVFSVCWFLVFVSFASISSMHIRLARGQRPSVPIEGEALKVLEQRGARVTINANDRDSIGIAFPSGCALRDQDFILLGSLVNLRTLDLPHTQLDDEDLKRLASLREIESLNLRSNPISDEGIAVLGGFSKLRRLNLSDTRMTDRGLAHLSGLALRELLVEGTDVSDAGMIHLRSMPLGRFIGGRITDDYLANLRGGMVETARIVGRHRLRYIEELPNLKTVHLNQVDDDAMEIVARMGREKLEEVTVHRHNRITDRGLAHLCRIGGLRVLVLDSVVGEHNQITDDGLGSLAALSALEHLELWGRGISDEGMVNLAGLKNLTHLRLCDTNIRGEGLVHLQHLTKLEYLNVIYSPVTDKGLLHLRSHPRLRRIDAHESRVTDYNLLPGVTIELFD